MANYWASLRADRWTVGDLRWHWGAAYVIFHSLSTYRAMRRDEQGETLIADTAEQLVTLIRDDYDRAPVPR